MAIRTIRAPGVEITEIDKSQYTPSMVGTTVLVAGFASKGESYEPTTITSKASFVNFFGEPTNEAERYFYAACNEVLAQNGTLIACKLPYDNIAADQFRFVTYKVNPTAEDVQKYSTLELINAYTDPFKNLYDDGVLDVLDRTKMSENRDFIEALKTYILENYKLSSDDIQKIRATSKIDTEFLRILKLLDVQPVPEVSPGDTSGVEYLRMPTDTFGNDTYNYFPTDLSSRIKDIENNNSGNLVVNKIVGDFVQDNYIISSDNLISEDDEIVQRPIVAVKVDKTEDNAKAYVKNIYFNTNNSNVSAIYSMREFSKVNSVVLPDSVQYIGKKAFENDTSLRNITFGPNTKYIGSNVLNNAANNGTTVVLREECTANLSVEANTFSHIVLDNAIFSDGVSQGKINNFSIYLKDETATGITDAATLSSALNNLSVNIRHIDPDGDGKNIENTTFRKTKLFGAENSEMFRNVKNIEVFTTRDIEDSISSYITIEQLTPNGDVNESYKNFFNALALYKKLGDNPYAPYNGSVSNPDLITINPNFKNNNDIIKYCFYFSSSGSFSPLANYGSGYGLDFTKTKEYIDTLNTGVSYINGGNNSYSYHSFINGLSNNQKTAISNAFSDAFNGYTITDIIRDLYENGIEGRIFANVWDKLNNIIGTGKIIESLPEGSNILWLICEFVTIGRLKTYPIFNQFKQTIYNYNNSYGPSSTVSTPNSQTAVNELALYMLAKIANAFSHGGKVYLTTKRQIPVTFRSATLPVDPVDGSGPDIGSISKKLYEIVKYKILLEMSVDEILEIFDRDGLDLSQCINETDIRTQIEYLKNSKTLFTSCISDIDSSVHKYQSITGGTVRDMNLSQLDSYITGESSPDKGDIIIIDKLGGKYARTSSSKQECLGIIPVITTATNALLVQGLVEPSKINAKSFESVERIRSSIVDVIPELAIECASDNINETTVSKLAARYFPPITFMSIDELDHENFKKIGVVVLRAYVDSSISNKVNFEVLESFAGSLDKSAVDPATGISTFIDTIVNNESEYIYLFSNVPLNTDSDIYSISLQPAASLGWCEEEMKKTISLDKSISKGLNIIFEKNEDIHEKAIDIVLDAGISNIAQFVKTVYGDEAGVYDPSGEASLRFKLRSSEDKLTWAGILQKYNEFCSKTRRDCMFIADGLRPICIQGNKKVVRPSKPTNTIDSAILPNLKYLTGINTNYGAGYMDWFEIADDFTGEPFWCPPSIQACGCYIFTDINYNFWDAPAGQKRGNITALDVAFSPSIRQAGEIYDKSWNYAINYADVGLILEGQKTLQLKPSAFDRVNVRRLFLRLERQVYHLCRQFVYEPNNVFTRQCLVDRLDPIFSAVRSAGGIYDYKIICDETINTPEVIDNNELRVKIGIKPTKTAEFILVQFYALRTNGSWDEMDISYSL